MDNWITRLYRHAHSLSISEWLDHLSGEIKNPSVRVPELPEERIQVLTNSLKGVSTLIGASHHYEHFLQLLDRHEILLDCDSRILDFGCGWGRLMRFFLRDVYQWNIAGVDVQRLLVDAARESLPAASMKLMIANEALPFASKSFDLVYSVSVFSHLNESFHLQSVREISRVLKPGGILVNTYLGKRQIMSQLVKNAHESHLAKQLGDLNIVLSQVESGRFVFHAPLNHRLAGYGTSVIGDEWFNSNYSSDFNILEFSEGTAFTQSMVLAQKL